MLFRSLSVFFTPETTRHKTYTLPSSFFVPLYQLTSPPSNTYPHDFTPPIPTPFELAMSSTSPVASISSSQTIGKLKRHPDFLDQVPTFTCRLRKHHTDPPHPIELQRTRRRPQQRLLPAPFPPTSRRSRSPALRLLPLVLSRALDRAYRPLDGRVHLWALDQQVAVKVAELVPDSGGTKYEDAELECKSGSRGDGDVV